MKPFRSVCRVYLCLLSVFALFSLSSVLPSSVELASAHAGSPTSPIGIAAASAASIGVFPASIVGGNVAMGEIFLSEPAPNGGAQVNLSSNSPFALVPRRVKVNARRTSATFSITTTQVTSLVVATISANYGGASCSSTLTVNPTLATPALSAVSVSPSSITGGTSSQGTVTLTAAAPLGGAVVLLSSSNTGVATVPGNLTVPAGAMSATFTASTVQVSSSTSVSVSGSYDGLSRSASLVVNPPAGTVTMSSLTLIPTSLVGGSTAQGTVTLSGAAPSGGAVVPLSSSNTSAGTVPASVTVAAGVANATFTINTNTVASVTNVSISGSYGGVTRSATLAVNPPPVVTLSSLTFNPTTVIGGNTAQGTVTLSGAAPSGGAVVNLACSNPSAANVPTSVTVPAGSSSANLTATTSTVAASTSAMISGTYGGATTGASLTVQPATVGVQYFVATNGSDSNPGTQTQPFRTLSRGASVLTPGATLLVRAGTYTASTQLGNIPSGTSWSAPVTIKAFPGEQVTLVGETGYQVVYFNNGNHHIIVDGFIIDATGAVNGVKVTYSSAGIGSHHIRIINSEVKNATYSGILTVGKPFGVGSNEFINCRVHDNGTRQNYDHGIYLECDNELVDGCEIYNNAAYGVHIYEDQPSNITVRNSVVYSHHGAAGILIGSGAGNYVYNNVVYNNAWGIAIFYGGGGAVYNNTVCNNDATGIYVCCNAQSSTIDNNIVWSNGGVGIYIEDASVGVMTVRNNLSAQNTSNFLDNSGRAVLSGNLIGNQYDPRFVNFAARDYRLISGSSAIDSGRTIAGLITDQRGTPRPRGLGYEIGALEY